MDKREKFLKEIAEVINNNSLEGNFNDTPDYILAKVAVEAIESFAEASAKRDGWHGFKDADKKRPQPKETKPSCKCCPFTAICPDVQMKRQPQPEPKRGYRKPEAFDVPKEVQAIAELLGEIFPGSKMEIHRVEMPKRNPRNKRRSRKNRKGGRHNEQK